MKKLWIFLFLFFSAQNFVLAQPVPAESAAPATSAVAGAQAANPQQPSMWSMLLPFIIMFAVMYFLMIRPQQKKMKEQQSMLSQLKSGDEVVTASGMLGKITGIADRVVTLEIDKNVQIKLLKSQISQVLKGSVNDLKI